mmetsp:Transcript_96239/g.299817  ORF Transcript_96239/g.299817 Transcript_96239/m.299817 type:complete len:476 (-) Transcript_96239:27-1454(-)
MTARPAPPSLAGTLKGGTAGSTKGPMSLGDPFAAFLAVRQVPGAQPEATRLQPLWKTKKAPERTKAGADADSDPFASFMALRPQRPLPPPESATEQSLREDLLRTKRQLLEVGLKAELKALDPACPPETAARLRKVRKAQRYLENPERTLETLSGPPSESSESEPEEPAVVHTQSKFLTPGAAGHGAAGGPASRPPSASWKPALAASASAPCLGSARSSSPFAAARAGTDSMNVTALPPICKTASLAASAAPPKPKPAEDKSPILQGWWPRSKSWNVGVSNKELTAKRHNLAMCGGTVVLGNGRLPLFTGSHLLLSGFFYAFQVDAVDDKHFPLDGCRDLSFGFGVSRYPPTHRNCERPVFGYEIPDSIFIGYGDRVIDRSKWYHSDWNPKDLCEKDVVGVLIPPDGDIVVFVNGEQVLRVPTSLAEDGDFSRSRSSQRRTLWPVVDLHGRVCAVTLLTRQSPPNKPLQPRSRLR